MTVVVTGASGFLGRHIIDAQLARGREVLAFTRDGRRLDRRPGLTIVETDYAEIPLLPRACTVVHLAAVRNAPGASMDDMTRVNVTLTRRIALAALACHAERFIHFSTALVLGSSDVPLDESAPLVSSSDPYISSKVAGLLALESMTTLPCITLMPSIVYGPDHPLARNQITAHLRRLLARPFRVAIGGRPAMRNLVFVDDVVRAVERAEVGVVGRRLVAGEDVTQEELERAVFAAAGRNPAPRIVVPRAFALMAAHAADALMRRDQSWLRRLHTLESPWSFRPSESHTPLEQGIVRTIKSL